MQRLFEHHEVIPIHFLEQIDVSERVRRIRIAHQGEFRKRSAHLFDDFQVPTGFDLDFDATITGVNFRRYLRKELINRGLNPNRDAAVDTFSSSTEQFPERNISYLC